MTAVNNGVTENRDIQAVEMTYQELQNAIGRVVYTYEIAQPYQELIQRHITYYTNAIAALLNSVTVELEATKAALSNYEALGGM